MIPGPAGMAAAPNPQVLYDSFALPVARLCRRMIRDREAAQDAAQEVWFQLMKSLPSFSGRSSIGTWVWTVARRTIWCHIRREKVYSIRFMEDRRAWIQLECDECLTAILHCVHNQDRFIYLMRTLAHLGFAQIGEVLGLQEAAARQSYNRARRKIGNFLSSQCLLYNPDGNCRCRMKAPIKKNYKASEYRKVRELSRRIMFMEAAETFNPPKE
jgi:RNA polymerase sigma-70 factor (ECF subfamily)